MQASQGMIHAPNQIARWQTHADPASMQLLLGVVFRDSVQGLSG